MWDGTHAELDAFDPIVDAIGNEAIAFDKPVLMLVGDSHDFVVDNPYDGTELWSCRSFNGRGSPTVTPAGDLLYVVNGLKGDNYAVRPGGHGDVTATHMAWHAPRKSGRDLPSPIVFGVLAAFSIS